MGWFGDFDYDPDYPVYREDQDGLDPITRRELERIERREREDRIDYDDIPY